MERLNKLNLRVWLIFVFGICYLYTYFNELIPVRNGLGFDGFHYYKVVLDGVNQIANKEINGYHFFRIFPYILFDVFNFPESIDFTLKSFRMINLIAIAASIFYYYQICKYFKLKENIKDLGFILLFYSFPILKYVNYNPMQTDHISFFLAISGLYYTFRKKHFQTSVILILSLFNFPSLTLILLLVNFLPHLKGYKFLTINNNFYKAIVVILGIVLVIFSFLLYNEIVTNNPTPLYYGMPVNIKLIIPSAIMVVFYFIYIVLSLLQINHQKIEIRIVPVYLLLFVLVILFISAIFQLYPPLNNIKNGNGMSISSYAIRALNMPMNFLIYHIFYYGLIFIFFILFAKEIFEYSLTLGAGYFISAIFIYLFMIQNESRVFINLIPILLFGLLNILNKLDLTKKKLIIISCVGLVFSRFYIPINFDKNIVGSLLSPREYSYYPAQMYFMNSGPWVSYDTYKLEFIISFILLIIYFFVFENHRKAMSRIFNNIGVRILKSSR